MTPNPTPKQRPSFAEVCRLMREARLRLLREPVQISTAQRKAMEALPKSDERGSN